MPPARVKIGHIVQIIGAKLDIKASTPPTFAFYRMHTLRRFGRRSFASRGGGASPSAWVGGGKTPIGACIFSRFNCTAAIALSIYP